MPYLHQSKAGNAKMNYDTTTDLTSQDVFYTTDSIDNEEQYHYKQKYNYDNFSTTDYYAKVIEKYYPKHRDNDTSMYDYSTSTYSYRERKPRFVTSSESKDEHKYHQHHSPKRHSRSPARMEYAYNSKRESEYEKRPELKRSIEKIIYHNKKENDFDNDYKSTRRNDHKRKLYHNKNEFSDEYNSEPVKDQSPERHQKRKKRHDDTKGKKKTFSPKSGHEYQVFDYQEKEPQEEVFKYQPRMEINKELSSKTELKTDKYPVLVIKENTPVDKGSDMVYMPVVVINNKPDNSDTEHVNRDTVTLPMELDIDQVVDTNVQGQTIAIHTSEMFNQNTLTGLHSGSVTDQPTHKKSLYYQNTVTPSALRFAASLLESILKNRQPSQEVAKVEYSRKVKTNKKDTYKTNYKNITNYQVNVDIVPSIENVFEGSIQGEPKFEGCTQGEPKDETNRLGCRTVEDSFHQNYPVTKDYIKVNKEISEKLKKREMNAGNSNNISVFRTSMTPSIIDKNITSKQNESVVVQGKKKRNVNPFTIQDSPITVNRVVVPPGQAASEINHSKALSEEQESSPGRSTTLEVKKGSLAIPSYLQQEREIQVTAKSGTTRMRDLIEGQDQNDRKSTTVDISKTETDKKRSKKQSIEHGSPYNSQRESLLQIIKTDQKTPQVSPIGKSTTNTAPLKEQETLDSKMIMCETQQSQDVPSSDEALMQFTKSVFGIDLKELKSQNTMNELEKMPLSKRSLFHGGELGDAKRLPKSSAAEHVTPVESVPRQSTAHQGTWTGKLSTALQGSEGQIPVQSNSKLRQTESRTEYDKRDEPSGFHKEIITPSIVQVSDSIVQRKSGVGQRSLRKIMTAVRTLSHLKLKPKTQNLEINQNTPTPTLYKNKQQMVSLKKNHKENKKTKTSTVTSTSSKSETKNPLSKLSKLFSRKSKGKFSKPKLSTKHMSGILRPTIRLTGFGIPVQRTDEDPDLLLLESSISTSDDQCELLHERYHIRKAIEKKRESSNQQLLYELLADYLTQGIRCSYFFLGTSLYDQSMQIIRSF